MTNAVPPHWLRGNKAEWSPRRLVCLDTEARLRPTESGRIHTYRLGVATLDVRNGAPTTDDPTAETVAPDDPAELWDAVTSWTSERAATWAYAHNLAYDLAVSRALVHLPRMGWEVKQAALDSRGCYLRLRRGRRSLVLADSVSVFPAPLKVLGRAVGLSTDVGLGDPEHPDGGAARRREWDKLPTPADDDGDEQWTAYCRRDVAILRRALLDALEWWDAQGCGHWTFTGPGAGWALLRHRFLTDRILVHRDPVATELERSAYYGGRREVFHTGHRGPGLFPYLDYRSHYARIAAEQPVPVRLMGTVGPVPLDRVLSCRPDVGLILEVEIETETPCVPVRLPMGTTYPVGSFRTVLCSPEVRLAVSKGAAVSVLRGAYYRLRPALAAWGSWVQDVLGTAAPDVPGSVRLAAKGWSRTVTGKFGQLGRVTSRIGDTTAADCRVEAFRHVQTGARGALVHLAGGIYETANVGEPDNAVPAVAAWITSWARVELWDLMEAVGRDRVLWCDTDGIIVDRSDAPPPWEQPPAGPPDYAPESLAPEWWIPPAALGRFGEQVAVKAVYQDVRFRLPGEYELDGVPHVRGLRRDALRKGTRLWRAELWPGLPWQLERHGGHAFETRTVDVQFRRQYDRGVVHDDGRVTPLEVTWDGQQNVVSSR